MGIGQGHIRYQSGAQSAGCCGFIPARRRRGKATKFVHRTILALDLDRASKGYYRLGLSLLGKGGCAVVPKIAVESIWDSAERPFKGRLNAR